MDDPWFTEPRYRSAFADVWWQARWSQSPGAPACSTDDVTFADGTHGVIQVNALGMVRVRAEHVHDLAAKLRLAAGALEDAASRFPDEPEPEG